MYLPAFINADWIVTTVGKQAQPVENLSCLTIRRRAFSSEGEKVGFVRLLT
jgi:hypothetical protein